MIEQADDGAGPGESDGDSRGAEHDCKRGESVGAGVKAVDNECGRPDLPADADSVARDDLVAGKPDHSGRGDRPQVRHLLRVEQPVDGLPAGDALDKAIIATTNNPARSSARP